MKADFYTRIQAGAIDSFQLLSGDVNPLHADPSFAFAEGYKGRVVHGMLTAGFYSRLVGLYLPGKHALLHRLDASFLQPVFEGDELHVSGVVVAVHESISQIEIRAEILRVTEEKVSRAKIWVGMHE